MIQKRCHTCHAYIDEGDHFCMNCGADQTVAPQTKSRKTNNPLLKAFLIFIGITIFTTFVVLQLWNMSDMTPYIRESIESNPPVEESYEYVIEPGYEAIEVISEEEMQSRIETHVSRYTEDYDYITVTEEDDQFYVNFDINKIGDRFEAGKLFKSIVGSISRDYDTYAYVKDLNAHFYNEGTYLYSTRLYNLFLVDVISLNKDGEFYDERSNLNINFKTSQDTNFEFPAEREDWIDNPESTEEFVSAYERWYNQFAPFSTEIDDAFDLVNMHYIDEGIEPTVTEIRELSALTEEYGNYCKTIDEFNSNYYFEVFHQDLKRGCAFIHKSYVINIDGLKNRSVDRIRYSFLDYNLGRDYFYDLYTDDEEVVGDSA